MFWWIVFQIVSNGVQLWASITIRDIFKQTGVSKSLEYAVICFLISWLFVEFYFLYAITKHYIYTKEIASEENAFEFDQLEAGEGERNPDYPPSYKQVMEMKEHERPAAMTE